MNIKALLNTLTVTARTLPIAILYVTEGCNLRCMTCSYREPLPHELTLIEIGQLAAALKSLGLRHIVYSGGEPLLRRDFPAICDIFRSLNVKQTLLTNGLLLEKRLPELTGFFTEIIVSIDGPTGDVHNAIRGVASFAQIVKGVRAAVAASGGPCVSVRTVVQKGNFRSLPGMIDLAKSLQVQRISFLPADVLSDSFGRELLGDASSPEAIALNEEEVKEFYAILETFISEHRNEIESGFIAESPGKLRALAQYYEALRGNGAFPFTRCNAPMVSAVITSVGKLHPCFFLPAYGSIRERSIESLVNSSAIQQTRKSVRSYTLERCRTCVCTLHTSPVNALLNRF